MLHFKLKLNQMTPSNLKQLLAVLGKLLRKCNKLLFTHYSFKK